MHRATKLLLAVLVSVAAIGGCGNLSDSTKQGYELVVSELADAAGETVGASTAIDVLACDSSGREIYTSDSGTLTLDVVIDENVEFAVNLVIELTSLRIDYEALDSVDPNDPTALIPISPNIVEFEAGAGPRFVAGIDGESSFEYGVTILSSASKREYVENVDALFNENPANPARIQQELNGAGLYASPRYAIRYTIGGRDNFGNEVSTSTTFIVELTDREPCS